MARRKEAADGRMQCDIWPCKIERNSPEMLGRDRDGLEAKSYERKGHIDLIEAGTKIEHL
jgi:hypothetical protein